VKQTFVSVDWVAFMGPSSREKGKVAILKAFKKSQCLISRQEASAMIVFIALIGRCDNHGEES
jgi:hypothetical protein